MPETIQQKRCAKCEAFEIRGGWSSMNPNSIADLRIRENLTLEDRARDVKVSFSVQELSLIHI